MGFDVKSIQKWVGHKSMDTTLQWYGAAKDKEAKQEISDGLKDIYIPKNINTNNVSNKWAGSNESEDKDIINGMKKDEFVDNS